MKILLAFFIFIQFSFSNDYPCHKVAEKELEPFTFTYLLMTIYNASYYKTKNLEQINISYLRNLATKYTRQGWESGLKNNIKDEKTFLKVFNWIESINKDALNGDCFQFVKNRNDVRFYINGKLEALAKSKDIMDSIFLPWLGEKPMSDSMKAHLLGNIK